MAKIYETIADLMDVTGMSEEEANQLASGVKMPKLQHRWRLSATGVMDNFNLYMQVISCERPTLEFEEIIIPHTDECGITRNVRVAGKHTWLPLTMVIEDDASGDAARVLQQQLQVQQEVALGSELNYNDSKFDLSIEYLNSRDGVTDTWNMEGCWIRQVDYTSLDYSSSDVVTIQLLIQYDHAQMV